MILAELENVVSTEHERSKIPPKRSGSTSSGHCFSIWEMVNDFKDSILLRASIVARVRISPVVLFRTVDIAIVPTARKPIAKMAMAIRALVILSPEGADKVLPIWIGLILQHIQHLNQPTRPVVVDALDE